MRTKEMNSSTATMRESASEIRWRFWLRASTRDVWYTTSSTSGLPANWAFTTSRLSLETYPASRFTSMEMGTGADSNTLRKSSPSRRAISSLPCSREM